MTSGPRPTRDISCAYVISLVHPAVSSLLSCVVGGEGVPECQTRCVNGSIRVRVIEVFRFYIDIFTASLTLLRMRRSCTKGSKLSQSLFTSTSFAFLSTLAALWGPNGDSSLLQQ